MSTNPVNLGAHQIAEAEQAERDEQQENTRRYSHPTHKADWRAYLVVSPTDVYDRSVAVVIDVLHSDILPAVFASLREALDFLAWRPDEHPYRDAHAMQVHYDAYRDLRSSCR